MSIINFGRLIVCSLCLLSLASGQVPVAPTEVLIVTTQITQALWPESAKPWQTYTYSDTTSVRSIDDFIPTSTTITASGATATYTQYNGVQAADVYYNIAYVIQSDYVNADPICYFPTAGQWSLLPRIAFYLTIVFALVARKHDWLIGGALGAALTFSSLAAIQVSMQVWTKQAIAELDLIPMTGILAISCILAVPLMNWSSTLRELGLLTPENTAQNVQEHKGCNEAEEKRKEDEEETQVRKEYGPTRTVLVFWSLFVSVGFFSAFAGYRAIEGGKDWVSNYKFGSRNIVCTPLDGFLNITKGQKPGWDGFWFTQEFVDGNNCLDPCEHIDHPDDKTLFRSNTELRLFGMASIDHFFQQKSSYDPGSPYRFVEHYLVYVQVALSFMIIQGFMHIVFFWRHSPRMARWRIYQIVCYGNIQSARSQAQENQLPYQRELLGRGVAIWFYLFAISVIPLAPALFVITIIATERTLYWIPQSEENDHVGQWGAMAITLLVLIGAVICRLDQGVRGVIEEAKLQSKLRWRFERIESCRRGSHDKSPGRPRWIRPLTRVTLVIIHAIRVLEYTYGSERDYFQSRSMGTWHILKEEWKSFKDFCAGRIIKPPRKTSKEDKSKEYKSKKTIQKDFRIDDMLYRRKLREEYKVAKKVAQLVEEGKDYYTEELNLEKLNRNNILSLESRQANEVETIFGVLRSIFIKPLLVIVPPYQSINGGYSYGSTPTKQYRHPKYNPSASMRKRRRENTRRIPNMKVDVTSPSFSQGDTVTGTPGTPPIGRPSPGSMDSLLRNYASADLPSTPSTQYLSFTQSLGPIRPSTPRHAGPVLQHHESAGLSLMPLSNVVSAQIPPKSVRPVLSHTETLSSSVMDRHTIRHRESEHRLNSRHTFPTATPGQERQPSYHGQRDHIASPTLLHEALPSLPPLAMERLHHRDSEHRLSSSQAFPTMSRWQEQQASPLRTDYRSPTSPGSAHSIPRKSVPVQNPNSSRDGNQDQ